MTRGVELFLLYVAAPGLLSLVSAHHRWAVLPAMLAGAVLSFALLWFDPTFRRGSLLDLASSRAVMLILLRAGLVFLVLLAVLWASGHPPTFRVPRERPLVWLGVLALYPLLSAVPQELIYRVLFFHRYGDLFPTPAARIAASAIVFGWSHVLVHNWLAMLLAAAGGALLSITWHRSRSLMLVGLEHSLYGAFLFTAGIGGMFVNGVRLVSSAIR